MRPYITLLVGFIGSFFFINVQSQVIHFQTGKVIPIETSGQIIWKEGIFNNFPARFGTLVVKENRQNKQSRLISIPVIHIPAILTDSSVPPIFILNGGPGESNLNSNLIFEKLQQQHDLVFVGYRGVDGLAKLDCPCLLNALKSDDLTPAVSEFKYAQAFDSCKKNWAVQNYDLTGYNINEVAKDIEDVRELMRFRKIIIVSYSFGAMIAEVYQQQFPNSTLKNVFIAPRPLGRFAIELTDISRLSENIDSYFKSVFSADYNLLVDYCAVADSIVYTNQEINPERLMIYLFSKLYSFHGIQDLQVFLTKGRNGNWAPLVNDYELFYRTYGSKLVLGDMLIKKQNFSQPTCDEKDTDKRYLNLVNPVNRWFNNIGDKGTTGVYQNQFEIQPDTIPTLLICGLFDVVANADAMEVYYKQRHTNCRVEKIELAGHTDLLNDYKDRVEELIDDFIK